MDQEKSCLEKINEVLEEIQWESVPLDVRTKTKECLADFVGVMLKGSENSQSAALRKALGEETEHNPEDLALWLGSTGRMPDTDDGHRFAMAHPGVVINSTAIAMALHLKNVKGSDLLEAIIKGYEMYCYEGRVINPGAYLKRGIDATSVCGGAAAAVVAGSLWGLSREQLAGAISLAASLAGGLNQSAIDGSAQKYLVAGWGAKLGIACARMARENLGGPLHVFEGKLGYCNAFAPEPDEELLYHPRLNWDIRNVYIKRYACVRRIHATLDAISDIVGKTGLTPEQIKSVKVYGSQFLYNAGGYEPKDGAQAQTSVPYTVTLLLHFGRVEDGEVHAHLNDAGLAAYSHRIEVIKDPEIIALAEKDKSLWGAAKVRIETMDGTIYNGKQIIPYGDPELPFQEGTVEQKFLGMVEDILGRGKGKAIWNRLMALDQETPCESVFQDVLKAL